MSYCYSSEKYQKTWRPVSIADANRYSVSWSRRMQAEDMLIEHIFNYQLRAAACALARKVKESECKAKPQKAPLYTQYPAYPAARACIGQSAIAEFNSHFPMDRKWISSIGKEPEFLKHQLDPGAFSQAASYVAEAVNNRLCLDHLTHFEEMTAVESYRLFAVAMLDLRFDRLRDVIFAACILGDLVYALTARKDVKEQIHPLTNKILTALAPACEKYERSVINCKPDALPGYGEILARELMQALLPFLPKPQRTPPSDFRNIPTSPEQLKKQLRDLKRVPMSKRSPTSENLKSVQLRGLDEVLPPSIDQGERLSRVMPQNIDQNKISNPKPVYPEVQKLLQIANNALRKAVGKDQWGDPRVDEVSNEIRRSLFRPGIVEDKINTPKRKTIIFGSEQEGFINEKVLPRSRNTEAVEKIIRGSAAIEKQLKRFRWYGQREQKVLGHYHNRGSLDPHRLQKLGISTLIKRRWHDENINDYHGRPLVVLAKDGSSSNTHQTIFAGQILTAAFIRTMHIAKIRIVAADYSSGQGGPLVQWLYHPNKTSSTKSEHAVARIASLPPRGQGSNTDVLSVSYILQESLDMQKDNQYIHVINITDGKFNSPLQQVRDMVKKLREDYNLTYSFIVLGETRIQVPEADHIEHVPTSELTEPLSIAERIAKHINSLVRHKRSRSRVYHG